MKRPKRAKPPTRAQVEALVRAAKALHRAIAAYRAAGGKP